MSNRKMQNISGTDYLKKRGGAGMTARKRRKCRKLSAKTNFRKQTVERLHKMLRVTTKNVEKCQAIKR